MLVQLKSSEVKDLRNKWLEEQGFKCPVLNRLIEPSEATLDHLHKLKTEDPDESGKGCCRGVLSFKANSWEGKVTNSFRRMGLHKENITLPEALRNLATYLEDNKLGEEIKYIHPNEKPPKRILTKRSHAELAKAASNSKIPSYKKGILTKKLEELYIKYKITPKYLKR